MDRVKSIAELKNYLEGFKKERGALKIEPFEIPPFRIPNWPEEIGRINVSFYNKSLLVPKRGAESDLINLERRRPRRLHFQIRRDGSLYVDADFYFFFPLAEFDSLGESTITGGKGADWSRLSAFIVFSQCLDPLCKKIVKKLKRKLRRYREEIDEYRRVCEAVERSFEPLIPFVVADTLGQSGEVR